MQLQRTTIRLTPHLKRAATARAREFNITFQDLFTQALEAYLEKKAKKKAKKIIFHSRNLGAPLANLTREDIYAD